MYKIITDEQMNQIIDDYLTSKIIINDKFLSRRENQYFALDMTNNHYSIELFDDKQLAKEFLR